MLIVPSGLTVIVGGARSGKSALAVRLGQGFVGPVAFVATGTASDADMAARIERHREERPPSWMTIESPLLEANWPREGLLIVDCMTLWASNAMLAGTSSIEAKAADLADEWLRRDGPTIVVSNEVGLGVVPPTELGRQFQDLLGRINSTLAGAANHSYFVAAGKVLTLSSVEDVFS